MAPNSVAPILFLMLLGQPWKHRGRVTACHGTFVVSCTGGHDTSVSLPQPRGTAIPSCCRSHPAHTCPRGLVTRWGQGTAVLPVSPTAGLLWLWLCGGQESCGRREEARRDAGASYPYPQLYDRRCRGGSGQAQAVLLWLCPHPSGHCGAIPTPQNRKQELGSEPPLWAPGQGQELHRAQNPKRGQAQAGSGLIIPQCKMALEQNNTTARGPHRSHPTAPPYLESWSCRLRCAGGSRNSSSRASRVRSSPVLRAQRPEHSVGAGGQQRPPGGLLMVDARREGWEPQPWCGAQGGKRSCPRLCLPPVGRGTPWPLCPCDKVQLERGQPASSPRQRSAGGTEHSSGCGADAWRAEAAQKGGNEEMELRKRLLEKQER